jgi:hypothetical protein
MLLCACASVAPVGDHLSSARSALSTAPVCCASLEEAPAAELPPTQSAIAMDATRPVIELDGSKSYFLLYRLPPYAAPYSVSVTSIAQDMAASYAGLGSLGTASTIRERAVLVPRVLMFDAAFKTTRVFDDQSLRARGDNLELTIFVNPDNAHERYMLIHGANRTKSTESSYATVTSMPIYSGGVVGTFVYGQEARSRLHDAPTGTIQLKIDPPAATQRR